MKMSFHCLFIEFFSLPFNNGDSIFWTMPKAGAKTIAELLAHQHGLTIHDLKGPFRAVGNAETATVTSVLVNLHNLSRCHD
jgi:hypothetical protein